MHENRWGLTDNIFPQPFLDPGKQQSRLTGPTTSITTPPPALDIPEIVMAVKQPDAIFVRSPKATLVKADAVVAVTNIPEVMLQPIIGY
jgi:hypothetical protein